MYLGLDIGTSVIKAALFGADGGQRAEAAERMQLLPAPPGWSELDGEAVWQAAVTVIRKLFAESGLAPDCVRAVGVTGVMVGVWPIDCEGRLLRFPILWNDARAATAEKGRKILDAVLANMAKQLADLYARQFA